MASIVSVDSRRRVRLPKEFVKPGDRVLVLPAGGRLVIIPIPPRPLKAASSWLRSIANSRELVKAAEESAEEEVEEKLRRREHRANRD